MRHPRSKCTRIGAPEPHSGQRARMFVNGGSVATSTGAACIETHVARHKRTNNDARSVRALAEIVGDVEEALGAETATASVADRAGVLGRAHVSSSGRTLQRFQARRKKKR